jgi:hypothetical protein
MSIPNILVFYTFPHSPGSLQIGYSPDLSQEIYASVQFKNETCLIKKETTLESLTLQDFCKQNDFNKKMTDVLHLYEMLNQRKYNDPKKFGLVPHKLSKPILTSQFKNLQEKSVLCKDLLKQCDRTLWTGTYGWFAPNSDPEKFGSLFLTPTLMQGKTQWVLMQMGIEEILDRAEWNNTEEIKNLVQKCCEDPELALTIGALQNSENLKKKTQEYEYKTKILAARQDFEPKKNQIRPRLSEMCTTQAAEEVFGKKYMVKIQSFELRPYSVFGWKTVKEERAVPIWAASAILFKIIPAEEVDKLDEMYNLLQNKLKQRNLGTVVKQIQRGSFYENTRTPVQKQNFGGRIHVQHTLEPMMWIVKNKEMFFKHFDIFNATDDQILFLEDKETFAEAYQQPPF